MLSAIAQKLLDGAFALGAAVATPRAFRHAGCLETTHTIKWGLGVSAGEVTIYTADKEDDGDGWSPYAVVPFTNRAATPYTDTVRVQGNFRALKHQVTAIVLDGTVTTNLNGAS